MGGTEGEGDELGDMGQVQSGCQRSLSRVTASRSSGEIWTPHSLCIPLSTWHSLVPHPRGLSFVARVERCRGTAGLMRLNDPGGLFFCGFCLRRPGCQCFDPPAFHTLTIKYLLVPSLTIGVHWTENAGVGLKVPATTTPPSCIKFCNQSAEGISFAIRCPPHLRRLLG